MNADDTQEVYEIYEKEGHGYALESYLSSEHIENPELKILWENAANAIQKLTKYFEDKVEKGELEFFEY